MVELLAPAGSKEAFIAAVEAGAIQEDTPARLTAGENGKEATPYGETAGR